MFIFIYTIYLKINLWVFIDQPHAAAIEPISYGASQFPPHMLGETLSKPQKPMILLYGRNRCVRRQPSPDNIRGNRGASGQARRRYRERLTTSSSHMFTINLSELWNIAYICC